MQSGTFVQHLILRAFTVCTILAGLVGVADAQLDPATRPPTQQLLPETTVAFIQVDNYRDLVMKMQDSSMGQMMQDEAVANLTTGLWDEAKMAYEDVKADVGLEIDDLMSLPSGEMTFAVIAPRRKNPEFLLLLELDDETKALDRVMDRGREVIETRVGEEITQEESEDGIEYESFNVGDRRVRFFRMGGLIVGSTSEEELDAFVDRWAEREVEKVRPLTANRKFVTIMNRCKGTKDIKPEGRFFIDPISLAKSATRGNVAAQVGLNFLPAVGLDGLLGVGGSMLLSEDDFESVVHAHMLLANPRSGVFEMVALKPTDYEPETWLPNDIVSYMTTSWDVDQMLSELTKMIESFQGEGVVDTWIENNINAEIELDLKEDILAHFTGRVTFTQWMDKPIKVNSQVNVIAMEINDLEAFEASLEAIIERINRDQEQGEEGIEETDYKGIRIWAQPARIMEERMDRRRQRRIERGQEDDVDVDMNVPQPAFALIGNYLVISPQSRQFLEVAIDTEQGDGEALMNDIKFQSIAKKMNRLMKTDMPCAMMYQNPEESMRLMYELVSSDNTMSMLARGAEDNQYLDGLRARLEENPLPPFEDLQKFFKPSGGYATSDDTGYHLLAFALRADPSEESDE